MTTQYTTNRLVAVCALVTAGLFALSSCADGTNTLESGDSVRGAAAAASQNASPESAPTSAPSPSGPRFGGRPRQPRTEPWGRGLGIPLASARLANN